MIPQYGDPVKFWIVGKKTIDNETKEAKIVYWGYKKGYGSWTDDLAQATHFKTIGAARSKLGLAKQCWYNEGDHVFVAEGSGVITLREIQ